MVIIYINIVELETPMLHAKFQDHKTSGSEEEDFYLLVSACMSVCACVRSFVRVALSGY